MPRICGPKLSNCCFVLSIWGIVMLILMGIFFQIDSVALIEDIPSANTVEEGYKLASRNCFIAAGIYGAVLIFCCYQKWAMTKGYTRL